MRTLPRRALAPVAALALAACSATSGHAPIARIAIDPPYLPVGDDHATPVTLDGTASSDDLDPPDAAAPLAYAWTLDDGEAKVLSGDRSSARLVVTLAARAPTRVVLVVTTPGGVSASATAYVGVTVDAGAD